MIQLYNIVLDIYERYDEHKLQNRINSHDESEEKFWRDHINQKSFLIKNSQPNARRSEDFSRNREYHNHQFIDQDHLVYCRKR